LTTVPSDFTAEACFAPTDTCKNVPLGGAGKTLASSSVSQQSM
jgi:hypothetical protein